MSDCPIYELPNQKREHIEYAESEFEEMGADLDDSEVVFVGGTLYAHDYKARHPEADVTAVEVDPVAAYTHRFAGYQLEEGTEPEQIAEYLFNFGREKQEGENTVITQEEYEEIREVHEDFVEDEDLFDEDFLEDVFFMEPDYGAEEVVYSQIEDDDPKLEDKESFFFNYKGNIVGKWAKEFKDNHLSGYRDEVEETIDTAQEQLHEEHVIDTEELREVAPEPREDTYGAPLEKLIDHMQEWQERSHRRHAAEEESYIHATETEDGRVKISKTARSMDPTHEKLLENIEQVERPDEIMIEDVRNVEKDADIVFSNNVFSYINENNQVNETIDSLASEDGAVLEVGQSIEDGAVPDRVNHFRNPHSAHIGTSLN
jgi:hypothetical protein